MFVDESSAGLLDSESCYLPVLSGQSSETSSPPQTSCKHDDRTQTRLVSDATKLQPRQQTAGDGTVVQPAMSALQPKSHYTNVDGRLPCRAARTLNLESSVKPCAVHPSGDRTIEMLTVGRSSSHDAKLRQVADADWKLSDVEQTSTERSSEQLAEGKYGEAGLWGYSEGSHTHGWFEDDVSSCTDKRSDAIADRTAANFVTGHQPELPQSGNVTFTLWCCFADVDSVVEILTSAGRFAASALSSKCGQRHIESRWRRLLRDLYLHFVLVYHISCQWFAGFPRLLESPGK